MNMGQIKEFLGSDWLKTESLIRSSLNRDIDLLNATNKAVLEHSGKQLRPILALLIARACSDGHITSDTIKFAAASELLHNATLFHDDVADNSSERRGVPTVMSILGGRASVLLGDFWLVKAMENILDASVHGDIVIRIFAKTLSDLATGEMLQLEKASSGDTQEIDYLKIIYNKTASLFVAAGTSAAISVGASDELKEAVVEYVTDLGLAFQIKDDIMDYEGGELLGKPAGQDLIEQKITIPLLGALINVDDQTASKVRIKVCEIDSHPEYVSEIQQFVKDNQGMKYASKRLDDFVLKGINALAILPESKEKEYLRSLAEFVAFRKS